MLTQILFEKILSCRLPELRCCNTEHTLGCLLPTPSPLASYWHLLEGIQDLLEACPTAGWIFLHNLKQLGKINTLDRNMFCVNDLKPQGQKFKVIYCHL